MKHDNGWLRGIYLYLVITAFFAVAAQSVQAQATPTPQPSDEVQKLKDQVKELEKLVNELKKKIDTVEEAQKQAPTAAKTPLPSGVPVAVDTKMPAPPTPPKDENEGKSTFEVYGFAMLDIGYDFKTNNPDWYDVIRTTKLPSFAGEFAPNGKVYAGVRQSRLGVKSSTPTKYGDLKTQFEFELFGTGVDAGQTTFRLRHAYGELGPVGAGQYWSPFMDIDVFPNSIEYWGPAGMAFFRNVQFRWMPIKGRSFVTFAIEKPGASGDQGVYADRVELQGVKSKFDLPDFSGEARFARDWGYVEVAGILRKLKWVDTNTSDQVDLSGSDIGWGLNFSSNLNFTKKDVGRFQFVYGEGIQNYMNDAPVDIGIQNNFGDPRRPIIGVALPVTGIVAFLDHTWNEKFSSAIGYSFQNIANSNGQAADAYHRGHYALGNLMYYPVKNVMMGGEFQYGKRENYLDGFTSDTYRIQFSFKYNFSKVFRF